MSLRNLDERLGRMPMVRALLPFAAGIVLAEEYLLPLPFVWGGLLCCGAAALLLGRRECLFAALLLFGWGVAELGRPGGDPLPRGVRTEYALRVADGGEGVVGAWRDPATGAWRAARVRVLLRADSTLRLRPGERLLVGGWLRDFPQAASGYGALMRRRGLAGTIYLAPERIIGCEAPRGLSLHGAAVGRLERLGLSPGAAALCGAMAAGERSTFPDELNEAYARSGTIHLLSVSGLHVGIVFMLVRALLGWLPLVRRGHLVRNVAAILLIWLYAAATGLSPSVVRAALMCSVLQLSMASSSLYVSGNALAATAFVMLIARPGWLFDISFQLSFAAVAAIFAWGVPLCRALRTGIRPLDALVASLAVGAAATAATAPLLAHTFGTVSVAGLAANPAVVPLSTAVVFAAVLWMAFPVAGLEPLFRAVLETGCRWQNGLVLRAAEWPGAAVGAELPAWATVLLYLLMTGATVAAWCVEREKKVSLRP